VYQVRVCNITAPLVVDDISVIINNTNTQEFKAYVCTKHPTSPELAPRTARHHSRNLARPECRLTWATCLDGTTFPAGGYRIGIAPVAIAANWSPNVFTGTRDSFFVPDSSTADQTTGAPTAGGHNWAFDQGSTLCKQGDAGSAAATTA